MKGPLGIFSSPIIFQSKPSKALKKLSNILDHRFIRRAVYFRGKNSNGNPAIAIKDVNKKNIKTDINFKNLLIFSSLKN